MRTTIPLTARAPRAFTPKALLDQYEERREAWSRTPSKKRAERPEKPVFYIAVPTLTERDTIGQLMFELGIVPVTRDDIRHATLRAAIENEDDENAEETAAWLEGFWLQKEIDDNQLELWQEQENQRLIDQWADPETKREPFPRPEPVTTLKDRMRAKDIVDAIVARSPSVRRLVGEQQAYSKKYDLLSMRVHLRGWQGLKTEREAEGGPGMPDLVTEECLEALRDEIGNAAWREIALSIDGMYSLSAGEVGNFGSPQGSGSTSDGSTPVKPKTDSGTSLGSEKAEPSSSEPTPAPASEATTAAS